MKQKILLFTVISISLISLIILSTGVSHAYFSNSKVSKNALKITTGNLVSNITYNPSVEIKLKTFSDEYALKAKTYDIVKVKNECDYDLFYTLVLTLNEKSNAYINFSDIHVSVHEIQNDTLSDPILGPVSLAELPIYEKDEENPFFDKYTLIFGNIENRKDKDYAVKVWIDINQKDAYRNSDVIVDLSTQYKATNSKYYYDIKGVLTDVYNNPLEGVKLSIQNGNITTTTNENGEYELKSVPTGTWNMIASYEDQIFKSIVNIETGEESLVQTIYTEQYKYKITGLTDLNNLVIDQVSLMLNNAEIIISK